MPGKTQRSSNLELLRILCMLLIIGDHLTGQGGIADYTTLPSSFAFCLIGCGSRIACSVFILIGGWFLCEQPYKTRRPLSLWLSLWLYTVPVTLLCRLAGLDVSFGALRWAAFPASTRQLWFISDYLLLLLCVPLLNRVLRGLPRTAHRGLLAVLAVPMILYPTLFGENGIVSDTAWMFLYEYLLAAYLRRYPENRLARLLQNRAAALALGLGLPLVNTAIRAVLETRGLTDGKAFQYVAYYRTALGALPNLLAALALFYLFKNLVSRLCVVGQRPVRHDAGRLHSASGARVPQLFVERPFAGPGAPRLGGVHAVRDFCRVLRVCSSGRRAHPAGDAALGKHQAVYSAV